MSPLLAFLEGPDLLIVLAVLMIFFGGSQLPKLARSLGQAKRELDEGLREGAPEPSSARTDQRSDGPNSTS